MLINQTVTLGSNLSNTMPANAYVGPCAMLKIPEAQRASRKSVRCWSKGRIHCAQAMQANDTVQKSQQKFQHWWQKVGVKADALEPADFAGEVPSLLWTIQPVTRRTTSLTLYPKSVDAFEIS